MMRVNFKKFVTCILPFVLCGCDARYELAPVVESKWHSNQHASTHTVFRGETLYAIAFRYDLDYRQLAQMNHLSSPYTLHVGQVLRVNASNNSLRVKQPVFSRKIIRPTIETPRQPVRAAYHPKSNSKWLMPADGRVVVGFSPELGHKGMNIEGSKGSKIHASASGVVAYAGNGIAGYGNLIIIKHAQQYMTAYGNNERNLVKEGQVVKSGQVIAEMGVVDQRYWGVHFEIRNAGKPVNPANYL